MNNSFHSEQSPDETRSYDEILSEYYSWQNAVKIIHKGAGCPLCGRRDRLIGITQKTGICISCTERMESYKQWIEDQIIQKTLRLENISSQEIPFLISLSDQDKYALLFRLIQNQTVTGQKNALGLVRSWIDLLQIETDTDYFLEVFYPVYLKEFTTKPGLLPEWCAQIPIGLRDIRKPGEMIFYIDQMVVYDQKEVHIRKKTGKLFTLTWGRDRIYSHAKAGEETDWDFFEVYQGTVVISSDRIIPMQADGTSPFVFLNARIKKLTLIPLGIDIILDGHDRPYRITGLNEARAGNIRFCMEHLVKKGTGIERATNQE
ncbi:MAG TPA: hypothetical protein PK024_06180 [Methanospirillum sp.]|uniref:hypothetical protein n=1 Tax=Methanospirillum sp. TaxID=45200 RepID=UPI002B7572A0|nr:hypothetical protein [Methanospirillum sp.]HOJ96410.1 hypothetical protein [Methanospirillum sp.]